MERQEAFAEDVKCRLFQIDNRLGVIEHQSTHTATKADVAGLETRLVKWFVATSLVTCGLTVAAAGVLMKSIA